MIRFFSLPRRLAMFGKILKVLALTLVVFVIGVFGFLEYFARTNYAAPTDLALSALQPDDSVSVVEGDWLVIGPEVTEPSAGLILYPGANCDVRGYAPVLREVAAAGYLTVAIPMPYDFAIFGAEKASDVMASFPNIEKWVLVGHSMGGAAAGQYAARSGQKLAGLILWDGYPPANDSLEKSPLPVTSIHRATLTGNAPQKFLDTAYLMPPSTEWVPVPGGIHMNFGSFSGGGYQEEWEAEISEQEQHRQVIEATVAALKRMTG